MTNNKKIMLANIFGEPKDVSELLITKTKTDLLSSLKNINKEYAKKYMEENYYDDYNEWEERVLMLFTSSFEASKNNALTIKFFQNLVINENTENLVFYSDDVESNNVFLYEDNGKIKYYIPDEIRNIVWEELSKYTKDFN